MAEYRYGTLTSALRDKQSPLRLYLEDRFPRNRVLQAEYRAGSGELLVDTGTAHAGTVGTAFDIMVRLLLDPGQSLSEPTKSGAWSLEDMAVIERVLTTARREARSVRGGAGTGEELARACWALALCTEVYRSTEAWLYSPLASFKDGFTEDELLALAPEDAIGQLQALRAVAKERLLPRLGQPVYPAPRFEASDLCNADADLIAGGILLDLKTKAGAKNARTGQRADSLTKEDLLQVISYLLFDTRDIYGITSFGIYSARYGNLTVWPLQEGLEKLAGGSVDLGKERKAIWSLLEG